MSRGTNRKGQGRGLDKVGGAGISRGQGEMNGAWMASVGSVGERWAGLSPGAEGSSLFC